MYTLLNPHSFPRYGHFRHFYDEEACALSLCDNIDVTGLFHACHERKLSFYISMLYAVSRVVNSHDEFKMTAADRPDFAFPMPAVYDRVDPVHNIFHEDSETYTSVFTIYKPDFAEFYHNCAEDIEHGRRLKITSIPTSDSIFEASCVPWRGFTSVGINCVTYSLTPVICWGKIKEQDGRAMMPLSIQINHAAADGFHLARFLNECEKLTSSAAEMIYKL